MTQKKINRNKTAVSWSGGKDSCLACYKARQQGYSIAGLLNFISGEYQRCCFHGISADLLKDQARCLGIPLVQQPVPADMQAYERVFKRALRRIKKQGISEMVFGDIYLDEHKQWVDRVCGEAGIKPIEPLWQRPANDVALEFISSGFVAIVVSAKADLFDRSFVGRRFDRAMIRELTQKKICPCGENGEFHTLVVDGPLFSERIDIVQVTPLFKKGFWDHWFLDIQEWKINKKEDVR